DYVEPGADNVVAVRVDSTERKDIPPFGFVVDYLTFGGIYREVELRICDPLYIRNVYARPRDILADRKGLDVVVELMNTASADRLAGIAATLSGAARRKLRTARATATVLAGQDATDAGLNSDLLPDMQLWDLDTPNLYTLPAEVE